LAIITMQAMPITNCSHRNPDARAVPVVAVLDMFSPLVSYHGAAGATAGVQPQVIVAPSAHFNCTLDSFSQASGWAMPDRHPAILICENGERVAVIPFWASAGQNGG
jgi:hypothetical protein